MRSWREVNGDLPVTPSPPAQIIEQAVDLVGQWILYSEKMKHSSATEKGKAPATDFTILDDNAATYLARHALGGDDKALLHGKLSFQPPYSREIRCVSF